MLLAGARTVINTSEPPNDQIFAGKHHDLRMTPDISETEKVRNFTGFHPEDATGRKTCCQGATGTDVTCRSRNKSVQLAAVGQQKSKAGLGEVNFRFPIGFEGETGWNIPKHPKTSRNPWIPWFLAPTWVFPAEKTPPSPSSCWSLSKRPTAPHRSRRLDVIGRDHHPTVLYLLGGIPTPLKNMNSSVWIMKFPTEWKKMFQTTNQLFLLDRFKATVVIPPLYLKAAGLLREMTVEFLSRVQSLKADLTWPRPASRLYLHHSSPIPSWSQHQSSRAIYEQQLLAPNRFSSY